MRPTLLLLLLTFTFGAQGLFRYPAVSKEHVAFVHDGQVWVVSRAGGRPRRVTNTAGSKFEIRFSPDGRRLAFGAGEVRHAVELYTIDIHGGTPRRVTFLPSHQVLSQWMDDGQLLFHTNALSFSRLEMQLFTVSANGGLPRKLPLAFGSDGAIDPSGSFVAYTPRWPNPLIAYWSRYRGGAAPDVSLVDLRTGASETITSWDGWDATPMWRGSILYYVSDAGAESRRNVWSYDTRSKRRRQLTHFTDYDVREASIGGDAIVFRYGATIQLLDLRTSRISPVRIMPPSAQPELSREVDAASFISNRQLSNGRVLYEARGDLWLASGGSTPRNLTSTSGVFEREAALSPDGERIAYFSDAAGEYQLQVRDVARPEAERWTRSGAGFRYRPIWSMDGRRLVFADQRGAIFIADAGTREVREIDREPWAELPEMTWSPDASWLAYTRTGANRLTALWRYDVASGQRRQLTADAFNSGTPVFDPAGKHLFFLSYRNFATPASDWLSQRFIHRQLGTVMAVSLANARFTIEDTERRAFRLPIRPGSITALGATHDGNVVIGLTDANGASSVLLYRLDAKREEVLVAKGGDFTLAADGRQIVIERDGKPVIHDLAGGADIPLATSAMTVRVDLRAEWRQLFHDAWRNYRDFFFAPKVGVIDWEALRLRYLPLLEQCVTREEVNAVLAEMIGESSVGHAYVGSSGDVARATAPGTGMLGADFELDRGAYRIIDIVQGAAWDDTLRSPLAEVRQGEYLLAVNGTPIDTSADVRAAFAGLAEKQVTITVGPNPTIDAGARPVVVTTLASENALRYRQWVERNRSFIEQKSNGRIGYVHLPEFTTSALGDFGRQFFGQFGKEALIIDARWSLGGSTGHLLAESLARLHLNSAAGRETDNAWPVPRWGAHFGAKALLVNHITVSAGENFAFYFRKLGIGPIVGTRTWGGLTGLNPVPRLIDGGAVNVPNAPFFDDSGWLIEGRGFEPDIVVARDPAAEGDAQLDAAIELLMTTPER